NDRKAIKQTAENYPLSEYYDTDEIITQLGTGEALVTLLNEKGIPTPLAATMLCPPQSRMDILTTEEINALVRRSRLTDRYNRTIDSKSAYEILTEKLQAAKEAEPEVKTRRQEEEKSTLETIADNAVVKSMMRTAGNMIVRSLLGSLGVSTSTRRKKKSFF
ncbi:MAG: DUF853 family protein, partial [Chitinophagaceae bacterium]|nr:DUF853 family protein [Chitinophagaceae bacterium]